MILELTASLLMSARCAYFLSASRRLLQCWRRPLPHGLSTELLVLMTVSLVLTVSIWSHTDQAGIPCSCSSLLPPMLPSQLHTACGCSRWRSWWLSGLSEGGRPCSFHQAFTAMRHTPSIWIKAIPHKSGSRGFIDVSVIDLVFPANPNPSASRRGGPN